MKTIGDPMMDHLQEHAPFFYLKGDSQGTVRETNSFTISLLGEDPRGRPLTQVFVDFEGTLDPIAFARDPARSHRLTVNVPGGVPQTILCSFYDLGEGVVALGNVDIAEMRALQLDFLSLNNELNAVTRALHKANAQLEKLNELKNQFVGFAAHDLRGPVGVILTYAEFLRESAAEHLPPEEAGYVDVIHSRAKAMARLINDLLNIAMIESGKNEAQLELTGLNRIFKIACLSQKKKAEAKKVEVAVNLDPAIPDFPMDPIKVEQITVNLLGNAIEHTAFNSTVRLEGRLDGDHVVVSVSDQGPGIPEEMMGRLFQPFSRGQVHKPGGHTSHGLGLAIAKRMVEAHRGRIWAENKPGEGATFLFTLPIGFDPATAKETIS